MKKFLIGFIFLVGVLLSSQKANSQTYFTTVDSLKTYINAHIRNSAINAFTNLRLNTALQGIAQFLDSARLVWGGGGGGAADGNNYSSTLSLSSGVLTMGRNGLSSLTTNVTSTHVTEGTNLYFTNARARSALSAGLGIGYNSTTGEITADTATIFTYIPYFSWDNKSGYDSTTWLKSSTEVRNKSLVQDMTVSSIGMTDTRVITDSTISHKLVPKIVAVKSLTEMRALNTLITAAADTQYVIRWTDLANKRVYDYQYDPNDATSTDDGKDVIVAGTKRFIRRFEVYNVKDYGAKGDGTTDDVAAFRTVIEKMTGSKDSSNFKMYIPRGVYIIDDTLALPNSASWFTIEGEGMFQTQLKYEGTTGKDFLTLLNVQHGLIKDLEFVGQSLSGGIPSAIIRMHTDGTIIGSQGFVGDMKFERVLIRGNIGIYDYALRITCAPEHDQNEEQIIINQCYWERARIAAISNETFNSLWNRAYASRFSATRTAIRLAKPNPGGSVDSAGGSFDFFGCTVMSTNTTDTLFYNIGNQLTVIGGRSEGQNKMLLYTLKSAEASPPTNIFREGAYTMDVANTGLGQYHIYSRGAYNTFDGTSILPAGLLKMYITDSTTYTVFRSGNISIDTIRYSSNIIHEIPNYLGNGTATGRIKLYTDYGAYNIINPIANFRVITSTGTTTIDVSGERIYALNPASSLTVTNFTGRPTLDPITVITMNGNTTIKNNADIVTQTGADMVLPANSVIYFVRQSAAIGGTWVMMGYNALGGLTTNRLTKWDGTKFANSNFEDDGSLIAAIVPVQAPSYSALTDGFAISNAGGQTKGFANTATDVTSYSSLHLVNSSGYAFDARMHGASHAKANITTLFAGGPGGMELNTYDGGGGVGDIYFTPNATERFRVTSTGPKITLGSDASRDMWFRDASTGVMKRIAYGTTGQVLTATTGSDPAWSDPSDIAATFSVSDATPTTVVTITPLTGEVVTVEAVLVGIKSDGNGSVAGKKIRSFLRNASSTLTSSSETTLQTVNYLGSGLSTASFTITTSGSNIIIQFTGEAATDITGKVTYKITRAAAPL